MIGRSFRCIELISKLHSVAEEVKWLHLAEMEIGEHSNYFEPQHDSDDDYIELEDNSADHLHVLSDQPDNPDNHSVK